MNKLLIILAIILASTAAFAETYTVEKVINAATLKLTSGEEVKLVGLQVLEDETAGQEATEFLINLLEAKEPHFHFKVDLTYVPQQGNENGRLWAYAFKDMGRPPIDESKRLDHIEYATIDGKAHIFINATILKSGYATLGNMPPNVKLMHLFKAAHNDAREHNRGMWKEEANKLGKSQLVKKARNYIKESEEYRNYLEKPYYGGPAILEESSVFENPNKVIFSYNAAMVDGACYRFIVTMDEDGALIEIETDHHCDWGMFGMRTEVFERNAEIGE